jgi:hypothetical protein
MTAPDVDLWVTATAYAADDLVKYNGVVYKCLIAHTSDVFTVDLAAVNWGLKTDWVTATSYAIGDQAYNSGYNYTCLVAHTSGTFATDLAALKWVLSETIAMSEDGVTYVFYKPTDFLEVSLFSDENAIKNIEGQRILSDVSSLKMLNT